MKEPKFVLRKPDGKDWVWFSDQARARAAKAYHERRTGIALDIIKQTIVEEIVT